MVGLQSIDFKLPDETGKIHQLSDYLGKKIVLYFYPKDLTSGCSNQAIEFKNLYEEFKDLNCVIIGISKDSISSHKKFKEKYDLPFILLSDENLEVINKYDVYKEKMMYGKKTFGVVRTTLIIDESGKIISYKQKVKAKENPYNTLCEIKNVK